MVIPWFHEVCCKFSLGRGRIRICFRSSEQKVCKVVITDTQNFWCKLLFSKMKNQEICKEFLQLDVRLAEMFLLPVNVENFSWKGKFIFLVLRAAHFHSIKKYTYIQYPTPQKLKQTSFGKKLRELCGLVSKIFWWKMLLKKRNQNFQIWDIFSKHKAASCQKNYDNSPSFM